MMKNSHKRGQKGQFLIELMVAVGVAAVLIMALVSFGNASTRRATMSRQSNEATKLAQAGAEIVRNIKDANSNGGVTFAFGDTWNGLYTGDVSDATSRMVVFNGATPCPSGEWCLVNGTEGGLLGVFRRQIFIEDSTMGGNICANSGGDRYQIKRVRVVVLWDSPTGSNQRREVLTCLAPNR